MLALLIGIAPNIPGFSVGGDASETRRAAGVFTLYDYAWFLSLLIAGDGVCRTDQDEPASPRTLNLRKSRILKGYSEMIEAPAAKPTPKMPATSHKPQKYNGPSREDVWAMRKAYLTPALFHVYKEPIMIVEGSMQWLFDETGKRYLDCFAGIVTVSVGHCHPKVMAKVNAQNALVQHTTTIYLNPAVALLGKKLASKLPEGLDCSYIVNSGSDANDLAMTMARMHTGNHTIIALQEFLPRWIRWADGPDEPFNMEVQQRKRRRRCYTRSTPTRTAARSPARRKRSSTSASMTCAR
jgi:hypothetical protein